MGSKILWAFGCLILILVGSNGQPKSDGSLEDRSLSTGVREERSIGSMLKFLWKNFSSIFNRKSSPGLEMTKEVDQKSKIKIPFTGLLRKFFGQQDNGFGVFGKDLKHGWPVLLGGLLLLFLPLAMPIIPLLIFFSPLIIIPLIPMFLKQSIDSSKSSNVKIWPVLAIPLFLFALPIMFLAALPLWPFAFLIFALPLLSLPVLPIALFALAPSLGIMLLPLIILPILPGLAFALLPKLIGIFLHPVRLMLLLASLPLFGSFALTVVAIFMIPALRKFVLSAFFKIAQGLMEAFIKWMN